MRSVQRYMADDGAEFGDANECLTYEVANKSLNKLMSRLNPVPEDDGCRFGNGHGYVQQDATTVNQVMKQLVKLAEPIIGKDPKWQPVLDDPFKYRWGIIGRYLDDCGNRNLYRAWGRFMNMDDQYREWGQGYFAMHPNEGEQIELKVKGKGQIV